MSGIGIFHPLGLYNPYGSGFSGQYFSFGNISLKYTSSDYTVVTKTGNASEGKAFWSKWGDAIFASLGKSLSDIDIAALEKGVGNYGDPLTIADLKLVGLYDDIVTERMSWWRQNNAIDGLESRDGEVAVFNGIMTHNGELYMRRVREEYAHVYTPGHGVQCIENLGEVYYGKLELPVQDGMQAALEFHIMTDEEVRAFEKRAYDAAHYTMEESFLMDLEDGVLGRELVAAAADGDLLKSVETFSLKAARFGALLERFYGGTEQYAMLQEKLGAVIDKSLQAFSEKVSDDLARFFTENGVQLDTGAMSAAVMDVTRARMAEYQAAYKNGDIAALHTDLSVYAFMAGQGGNISVSSAQFGEVTYDGLTRLSEAVYEFSNTLISQQDNLRLGLNTTAEQTGMVLGLAKAQVRIMDDGSALFGAFRAAADNKINAIIDEVAAESRARYDEIKRKGGYKGSLTYGIITNAEIHKVMSWFDGIEYGDVQNNMALAMKKVYDSYMAHANNEVKYAGNYFSRGDTLFAHMPEAFWKDYSAYMNDIRSEAITSMQNYMLLQWNIWAGSSVSINNGSKYQISSPDGTLTLWA